MLHLAASAKILNLLTLGVSNHLQQRHMLAFLPPTREGWASSLRVNLSTLLVTPSLSFSEKHVQIRVSECDIIVGITLKTPFIYFSYGTFWMLLLLVIIITNK